MKTVSIAKLKDHLSQYLDEVERGDEIIIRNRKRPVAAIVRLPAIEEEEQNLVAQGKLRVPLKEMNQSFWTKFWSTPGVNTLPKKLAKAVVEDRNEER